MVKARQDVEEAQRDPAHDTAQEQERDGAGVSYDTMILVRKRGGKAKGGSERAFEGRYVGLGR